MSFRPAGLLLLLMLSGCAGLRPAFGRTEQGATATTPSWHDEILRQGHDGDWLIIHGYNSTAQLVTLATSADLSHVGILDRTRGEVVEAVSPSVQSISLDEFLADAD